MAMDAKIGQREDRRYPVRLKARMLTRAGTHDVWLTDISTGGFAIETQHPLEADNGILLVHDNRHSVECAWNDDLRYGLRVSTPLNPSVVEAVVSWSGGTGAFAQVPVEAVFSRSVIDRALGEQVAVAG